jgi:hypothetical protein
MPHAGVKPQPVIHPTEGCSAGPWLLFAVGILLILAAPMLDHQVIQDGCSWPARGSPRGW